MSNGLGFRIVVGFALVLATVSCGVEQAVKPITVDQAISQIDALNGRTASIVGYLGECDVYNCALFRNKSEHDEAQRAMAAMRAALDAGVTDVSGFKYPSHPFLSVGTGSPLTFFDMQAAFLSRSYVEITGTVSNRCRSHGVSCLDRASELEPIAIRAASAPSVSAI